MAELRDISNIIPESCSNNRLSLRRIMTESVKSNGPSKTCHFKSEETTAVSALTDFNKDSAAGDT